MKPQKFLKSYKCNCFQPDNYCNCTKRMASSESLMENVADLADSLIQVMSLCGVHVVKARAISNVIIYHFLHFEEIIYRIDSIPRKRLKKGDLMNDLARKCSMSRTEAQIAYSIITRAFKAFYYGTGLGGVPNIALVDKLAHTAKCLWVHATQRTAQICASYQGLVYAEQRELEIKIKLIYKQLYDRISNRNQLDDDNECICMKCVKRIANEALKVYDDVHQEHQELEKTQVCAISNTGKTRCSCPSLNMTAKDYIFQEKVRTMRIDSSPNPFECQWISVSKEEFQADNIDMIMKLPYKLEQHDADKGEIKQEFYNNKEISMLSEGVPF